MEIKVSSFWCKFIWKWCCHLVKTQMMKDERVIDGSGIRHGQTATSLISCDHEGSLFDKVSEASSVFALEISSNNVYYKLYLWIVLANSFHLYESFVFNLAIANVHSVYCHSPYATSLCFYTFSSSTVLSRPMSITLIPWRLPSFWAYGFLID